MYGFKSREEYNKKSTRSYDDELRRMENRHIPTTPITTLQKRWLKALTMDPRIRLFEDEIEGLDTIRWVEH